MAESALKKIKAQYQVTNNQNLHHSPSMIEPLLWWHQVKSVVMLTRRSSRLLQATKNLQSKAMVLVLGGKVLNRWHSELNRNSKLYRSGLRKLASPIKMTKMRWIYHIGRGSRSRPSSILKCCSQISIHLCTITWISRSRSRRRTWLLPPLHSRRISSPLTLCLTME